jgi:hypothetical protein
MSWTWPSIFLQPTPNIVAVPSLRLQSRVSALIPLRDLHTLSLVFEPMREPLWLFRRRVASEDRVTRLLVPLIKTYLQILLEGLDYLHSESHVIHTGIWLSALKLLPSIDLVLSCIL